jgi:hypothetical protein
MEPRDIQIITQSTLGYAATIVAASLQPQELSPDALTSTVMADLFEVHESIFDHVMDMIERKQLAFGTVTVKAQFPGATEVPSGNGAPRLPGQVPAGAGSGKADQAWKAYFADPGSYYDNRTDKRNPNSPDFKHKVTGEGLWLNGKYPAPNWVQSALAGNSF